MSNQVEEEEEIKLTTGGNGAHEYGGKVFGAAGQQAAVEGSNVIDMKEVKGGKGKKSRKNRKNRGGNILSEIAVPVTLLYANHAYSAKKSNKSFKKKSFKKKSFKNRRRSYRKYRK
jgi:hypothetical protein